ncbi:methyltransferase [Mesorhizobium sp. L103C119B0]|uniref:FkbM family methyltransferase n=1 Tax=Mesorhizobium sp. L103C119B0 TaxID=1287085 RepID=UPI0003D04278|nr:FkbM family methyltransferase [Mesorhizobium sp. L103C119B0]ESZ67740.1 methyltransferase [Mesorhizobium sp. L103C119B0]
MRLPTKLHDVLSGMPTIAKGEAAGLKIFSRGADPDFAKGIYEIPVQKAIASRLRAGDVFYDIGANIGFFSLIAARQVGATGQVYAYEPVPRNAAAIERSRDANGLTGLRVFAEAVGALSGQVELLLARHLGGATLATVSIPPDMNGRLEVKMTTLDASIVERGLRPPSLIKIDVEGAEMDVFRGMVATLEAHRPKLICEIDDATKEGADRKMGEIAQFLTSARYIVSALPVAYANDGWQVSHLLAQPMTM